MSVRAAAVAVALMLLAPVASAAELAAVVDAVVAAYGGEAALRQASSMRQSGRLSSLRSGTEGPVERLFQRPDRFRIVIRQPGQSPETRVLDGAQAWKDGAPAASPLRQSIVLQALRFDLPLLLRDAGPGLRDQGPVADEMGRRLRALAVPVGEGMTVVADVDEGTGRILRSRGVLAMGGQEMTFQTVYDDFRSVQGVLVAFREEHWAMGMKTGATTLDKVEINPPLEATAFRP